MTDIYQGDPKLFLGPGTLILRASELKPGNSLWNASLISVWHMNSDWLDAKGSNNGARSGSGTAFDTVNQKLGSAAGLFNGIDDVVNFGNDASLQFTNQFSISLWFKANSWADFTPLIVKTDSGFANGWAVYWSSNELRFVINSGSNKAFVGSFTDTTSLHHLVATYDGAALRIYLDNVEGISDAFVGSVTDNTHDVKIGFQSGGAYFDGLLDEVAIWNRALSGPEVTMLNNRQNDRLSKTMGSDLKFTGGQPVLDRGLENLVLISLFTRSGWCGNVLFKDENQKIESDFEEISNQPITLQMINDLRNAAERALTNPAFGNISVEIYNPSGYRLETTITLQPPGQDIKTLLITKNGLNWIAQARDPAYLRG